MRAIGNRRSSPAMGRAAGGGGSKTYLTISIALIRSGDPQYIGFASLVGEPRSDEEEIGQAVDIGERRRPDSFAIRGGQFDDAPFGAAADRARQMQRGGGRRA